MPSVDLHAHLLPGVDDGPETLPDALTLARAVVAAGTSRIVATPHVNEHRFIAPEGIGPAVAALQGELMRAGIPLAVEAGAEIALSRLPGLPDAALDRLRLGDGPYLLLECPFAPVTGDLEALIFGAQARGHGVLLAHPERCSTFQREPDRLVRLVEDGALVQVTAGALRGAFGSRPRAFAHHLLHDGLVHVLASDAHDAVRRPPGLHGLLDDAEREAWLTELVPAAILAGAPLPEPPPLPEVRPTGLRRLLALGRER